MNLLIVDDEMLAIQGIVDDVPWEQLQFENIYTANSYAQAVNVFRSHKVDVLLCDIEMPMGNGIQLVSWVRDHYSGVECIFLTSHADFSFAQQAVGLSCLGYLLKPAETEEIVQILLKAREKVLSSGEDKFYQDYGKLYLENMKTQIREPKEQDVVALAEKYIQNHLDDILSLEDVANEVHVSETYLGRLFKKKNGITVVDYITKCRMELAKKLLLDEDLTISAVAARSGYSNYSYFTRLFSRYTGISPRDYRKQQKKQK